MASQSARILSITYSNLLNDARVRKQISLLSKYFQIDTVGYGPKIAEVSTHYEIPAEIIYWKKNRADLILHRYHKATFDSQIAKWFDQTVGGKKYDLVWVNDLDPLPLVLKLKPSFPVHADLHEYAPRQKEDLKRWRWFVAPYLRWVARNYLPQCASITTAWPRISSEYENWLGLKSEVVINASPYADLNPSDLGNPLRIVHSGIAHPDRALEIMIEAIAQASTPLIADFYLTGGESPYREKLKQLSQGTNITIKDPVPYDQLIATLNQYDIGIHCLPPVNFNNKYAIPNKFFDYIQARLALVMAPSEQMQEMCEQYGVGKVSAGFQAQDLTAVLDSLTAQQVSEYKAASHLAARKIAADQVITPWLEAVKRDLNMN